MSLRAWARVLAALPALQRQLAAGGTPVLLEYPVDLQPRWSKARPNRALESLMAAGRNGYRARLASFAVHFDRLAKVPLDGPRSDSASWRNPWIPPLDAVTLYGLVAEADPPTYLEVGSGESTRWVRQAIKDHGLRTRLCSIDPEPRAEIDALCDEVIRQPLERVDASTWSRLTGEDVLFFDGSHRCLANSDVTAFFLEVLPGLAAGCLVGVHDVFLPYDYPLEFARRLYSEQYLLGALLIGDGGRGIEVVLPNAYLGATGESASSLAGLWEKLPGLDPADGGLFWFRARPGAIESSADG